MKKISTLLLATTLTFAACHNDGSSTVGIYENDEPKEKKEANPAHEGDMSSEEHKPDTAKSALADTSKMSGESNMKKDTTHH